MKYTILLLLYAFIIIKPKSNECRASRQVGTLSSGKKTHTMRSSILFSIALFFTFTLSAYGSFEHHGPDARIESMGGAGVALETPAFGPFYNPAAGAADDIRSIGVSYALPFGKSPFDSFYASLQTSDLPFDKNGSAGISWQHYGTSLYSETRAYVTYSTSVAGPVRAGISAGLLQRDTEENGSDSVPGINLGILASITRSLNLGASLFNMNRPKTGNETVPSTTFAGITYLPAENIAINAVLEKEENKEARFRTGGEARVLKFLNLRAGFATAPSTFSGGAGFIFNNVQGDIGIVRHPELGTGSWYTMRITF